MKKRLLSLALAVSMISSMSGCKKQDNSLKPNEDFLDHYKTYKQIDINGEQVVQKYKGNNIVIAINKETNEVNEYLYYAGDAKNYLYQEVENAAALFKLGFIVELYDLETGELLYFSSEKETDYNIGYSNLEKIKEDNDLYNLFDLYDYGIEYKEWYTLEEVREIAQVIVNKNNKIKKLTNN